MANNGMNIGSDLEAFLLSNLPKLYKYAERKHKHLGLKCDPSELVHDVITRKGHLVRLSDDTDATRRLKYLYNAIDYMAREKLGSSQQSQKTGLDAPDQVESRGPNQAEQIAILNEGLERISDVDRRIFLLRHVHSMNLKEIADRSGMSEYLVKESLSRAVSQLQKIVDGCESVPR